MSPDGGDDRAGLQRAAVLEGEPPHGAALVELGGGHARAEAQVRAELALIHQRAQVGQDLLPRREAAAPAPRPERERVQGRRHITAQARVGVVPPDPPEVITPVKDDEVLDARLLERRSHADPPEPGTDHDRPVRRILWHGPSLAARQPTR